MTYRTIVADPPWEYDDGFAFKTGDTFRLQELPYNSMTLEQILEIPVRAMADPKGCALFLWTTNRFLADSFDVLGVWGFRYRQTIVWRKTNPQPVGGSVAPNAEFLLVARRGAHTWHGPRWPDSVIDAPRTTHSAKPEVFMDLVESISPPPYLEMFSRRARLGWDTWGDQALHGTTGVNPNGSDEGRTDMQEGQISVRKALENVAAEASGPLTAQAIVDQVLAQPVALAGKTPRASVQAQLYTAAKKGELFSRTGRGVFEPVTEAA